MKKFIHIAVVIVVALATYPAQGQSSICAIYDGAIVLNSDDEFIGTVSDPSQSNSIFNEYGRYGSQYQSESIWNQYGNNGSEYSTGSAFNPYTSSPPRLIKNRQFIGYLTANRYLRGAVNPIVLGVTCYDFQPPR